MSELNIPESWAEATFSEVFQVNPRNKIENDKLEVSFVPMGTVNQYTAEIESEEVKEWGKVKKGYTHFQDGDVIFAKITPCMENKKSSLVTNLKNGYGAGSTEFHVLRPPLQIQGNFALHFVRSHFFLKDAANNMSGTAGQKRVPTHWLNDYPFPIPPIKEQERIVQKIEACFSKIQETEQNLNKVEILLEKYRESLLAKAFRGELIPQNPDDEPASVLLAKIREERAQNQKVKNKEQEFAPISDDEKPFDIPENWIATKLYYAGEWGSGGTPLKSKREFYGGEINWMKTGDLTNGFVTNVPDKITKQGLEDIGNKIYPVGTVVMAMYGATIGKLGLLKVETSVNQACACCTTSSYVDNRFLFYWLMAFRKEYVALGQGGAQPNISRAVIYDQFFAIPPLPEQVKIVHKLEDDFYKISLIKDKVNQKIKVLLHMRNSLLRKAFEGRLVEQIESEGTGHELLQKILEQKGQEKSAKENTKKKNAKKVSKKQTTKK